MSLIPLTEIIAVAQKHNDAMARYMKICRASQQSTRLRMEETYARMEDSMSGGMIPAMRQQYAEAKRVGDRRRADQLAQSLLVRTKVVHGSRAFQDTVASIRSEMRDHMEEMEDGYSNVAMMKDEMALLLSDLKVLKKMNVKTVEAAELPEQMKMGEFYSAFRPNVTELMESNGMAADQMERFDLPSSSPFQGR